MDGTVSTAGSIGYILLFLFLIALYFLPTILSLKKSNSTPILMLNLFLGWSLIGWVIALVWAVSEDPAIRNQANANRMIEIQRQQAESLKAVKLSTITPSQEIERIFKLKEQGLITQEEFEILKRKALA